MNERIRQLAEQACAFADIQYNKQTRATFYTNKSVEEFFMDKFAELIVFECAKAVMDGTKEGDHYAQRIEQHFDNGTDGVLHFGVEE